MKDYYGILGVEKQAEKSAIKAAYKKLAVLYHPDKNQGDSEYEEKFKEINEAYQVLSDDNERLLYDLQADTPKYTDVLSGEIVFQRRDSSYYHEKNNSRMRFMERSEELTPKKLFRFYSVAAGGLLVFGLVLSWFSDFVTERSLESRYEEGLKYKQEFRYVKAHEKFTEVLAIDEKHAGAYFQKGLIYFESTRRYLLAKNYFDKSIELSENPTATMFLNRGICNYYLERYDEAIADFTTILRGNDGIENKLTENTKEIQASAHFHRASTYKILDCEKYENQILSDWKTAENYGLKSATDSLKVSFGF